MRRSVWPFVVYTLTMAAFVASLINYQTAALIRQFDARSRIIEQRLDGVSTRIDDYEAQFNRRCDEIEAASRRELNH